MKYLIIHIKASISYFYPIGHLSYFFDFSFCYLSLGTNTLKVQYTYVLNHIHKLYICMEAENLNYI